MQGNNRIQCTNCKTDMSVDALFCPECHFPRDQMGTSPQPDTGTVKSTSQTKSQFRPMRAKLEQIPIPEPHIDEQPTNVIPVPVWLQNTLTNMRAVLIHMISPSRDELPVVTPGRKKQLAQIDTLEIEQLAADSDTKPEKAVEQIVEPEHKTSFRALSILLIACILIIVVLSIVLFKYVFGQ